MQLATLQRANNPLLTLLIVICSQEVNYIADTQTIQSLPDSNTSILRMSLSSGHQVQAEPGMGKVLQQHLHPFSFTQLRMVQGH